MASTPSALPSPAEIVERESAQRRPAVIGAVAAALLTAVAIIVDQLVSGSGVPSSKRAADLVETLSVQSTGGSFPASFWTAYAHFKIDHGTETILAAGLRGVALLLLIPIVMFVLRGARERGGSLSRWLEPIVVSAMAAVGVATAVQGAIEIAAFKSAGPAFVPQEVVDTLSNSDLLAVNGVRGLLSLVIALPVAMMSIQAMRVGLLPKWLGFAGVLVGLLFVLPYDTTGLVRAAWFSGVAWVVSGRLAGGLPDAWGTGLAVAPEPRQPPPARGPRAKKDGGAAKGDQPKRGKGPKLTK